MSEAKCKTEQAYRLWVQALADRDTAAVAAQLAPQVERNGQSVERSVLASQFQDEEAGTEAIDVDMLVVSDDGRSLASRLIHRRRSSASSDETEEQAAYSFVYFGNDGNDASSLIVRIETLADDPTTSPAARTSISDDAHPQSSADVADLSAFYTGYIDAINNHTWHEDLPRFCHQQIIHNARHLTLDQYIAPIDSSHEDIEDMRIEVAEMIVSHREPGSQRIAVRLLFSGHPVKTFRGIEPSGGNVRMYEHALYQLRDGKIERAWAVMDMNAYKKCMESK